MATLSQELESIKLDVEVSLKHSHNAEVYTELIKNSKDEAIALGIERNVKTENTLFDTKVFMKELVLKHLIRDKEQVQGQVYADYFIVMGNDVPTIEVEESIHITPFIESKGPFYVLEETDESYFVLVTIPTVSTRELKKANVTLVEQG